MSDQLKLGTCGCSACQKYQSSEKAQEFNLSKIKQAFEFPKIEYPGGQLKISVDSLDTIFDQSLSEERKKKNVEKLMEMLTYLDPNFQSEFLDLNFYVQLCEYLLSCDLESAIKDDRLAENFLYRITKCLVMSWHAFHVEKNTDAEWAVRHFRRFLTQLLTHPIISAQVESAFFSEDKWPKISPLTTIEAMSTESFLCLDILSLLVNLTREEKFCNHLEKEGNFLPLIQQNFPKCRSHIEKYDETGQLILPLYINLARIDNFANYLIEAHNGYFMNIVLADLISRADSCVPPLKLVWPFFKNLSLLEKGREMIMKNLDLYLGHILYPIAGPEKIDIEDSMNLPLEVVDLHDTKARVPDKEIRECILDVLYSLCRYKKDRIILRKKEVYQILKHYHLAEEDTHLQEKIEDLVNILIRKEGSEIEVDDLMEGLSVGPGQKALTETASS